MPLDNAIVLPIVAKTIDAALLEECKASELYPVPGMGHDMDGIYNDRTREVIGGFFQRHLLDYPRHPPGRPLSGQVAPGCLREEIADGVLPRMARSQRVRFEHG